MEKTPQRFQILLSILAILLVASGVGLYFLFSTLRTTQQTLVKKESELGNTISELENRLLIAQNNNTELAEALQGEKERNDAFFEEIDELSGTVGILEKLSKTDPELLQKYSKVYFLNEHYIPPRLTQIDSEYVSNPARDFYIHADVWPYLKDLMRAAKKDDLSLRIGSAYRSFETQETLKTGYVVTYGAGTANQFSADQGYSEHQLGTTVDFTTPALGGGLAGFDTTAEYAWLLKNAHRYGFILSYPKGNAYYQYEPWHWRFVGKDLARHLERNNLDFYSVDQRTIDEYLVTVFD